MSEPVAFVFPGQGAQEVGMGRDVVEAVPAARAVFDRADSALAARDIPLSSIVFDGPADRLTETEVCQPGILAVSLALTAALRETAGDAFPEAAATAGHSLGEYAAMAFAGVLADADAVALVSARGAHMQQACVDNPSGMLAVIGMDRPDLERIVAESDDLGVVDAANYNCPGQIVVSAEKDALEPLETRLTEAGARRIVPLPVFGAYHSRLMESAREALAPVLDEADFHDPQTPVVSNVEAAWVESGEDARERLKRQVTSPVDWEGCCRAMLDRGVTTFYEVGPGRVLAGLMKKIDRGAEVVCVNDMESLEAAAAHMRERA